MIKYFIGHYKVIDYEDENVHKEYVRFDFAWSKESYLLR